MKTHSKTKDSFSNTIAKNKARIQEIENLIQLIARLTLKVNNISNTLKPQP